MNLTDALHKALKDAEELVENGYWVNIDATSRSVILSYGVIHSNGELETALSSKLYIADLKPNASKESQCLTTPSSMQPSEKE